MHFVVYYFTVLSYISLFLFCLVLFCFDLFCFYMCCFVVFCYYLILYCCCIVLLCVVSISAEVWNHKSRLISLLLCVVLCVLCVLCMCVFVLKIMLFSIHSFHFLIYSAPPHFFLPPSPSFHFSHLILATSLYRTVLYVRSVAYSPSISFLLSLCVCTHPFCSWLPTFPYPTLHFMFLRAYVPPSTTPLERMYLLVLNLRFISKIILSFRKNIKPKLIHEYWCKF